MQQTESLNEPQHTNFATPEASEFPPQTTLLIEAANKRAKLLAVLSETDFEGHAKQKASASGGVAEAVNEAVVTTEPRLDVKEMQHAVFAKQLLDAGEISLVHYVLKMQNLFPERLEGLDASVKGEIEAVLAAR